MTENVHASWVVNAAAVHHEYLRKLCRIFLPCEIDDALEMINLSESQKSCFVRFSYFHFIRNQSNQLVKAKRKHIIERQFTSQWFISLHITTVHNALEVMKSDDEFRQRNGKRGQTWTLKHSERKLKCRWYRGRLIPSESNVQVWNKLALGLL